MAFITYKQADSRWGRKNYNGSSTMATAGCGPTSCAMIAYGVDGKTTPLDTMRYMQKHGYAIRNNGTAWNGIPSCLKAFGVKDVQEVPNMAKCWELMKKGYVGVFLFRKGSRGGVTWTSSGHYIAVTGYKYQNGKHYVYTRDSGGRGHTGWYPYETTMRGLIPRIWLGKIEAEKPIPKPSGKYSGTIASPTLKKGSKGDNVKNLQRFLNWYYPFKLGVDGVFGDKTKSAVMKFQYAEGITKDGIYGKDSYNHALKYKGTTPKPAPKPTPKPTPAAKIKSYRVEVDLTNQIATVYGIYTDGKTKPIMSEWVSTAGKGHTTPTGNFKIQGASGGRKAKLRTAKMSSGKSYAEYLCRFKGGKCMHGVPYSKRNTSGMVYKGEFNKLGTPRSAGCVRMPIKMARYIYNTCPIGTPVKVFKGTKGKYPMGKPKKYTATSNLDPTR